MARKYIREYSLYVCVFLITAAFLFSLSVATELIDRSAMRENMRSSARFLCGNTVGIELWDGIPASKLDRYADCISLNIAWNTEPDHPFVSAMRTGYYISRDQTDVNGANRDLLEAVEDDKTENREYLRYWHGNAVPIRLMHLFTDITGMYAIGAVLLAALVLTVLVMLWRYGMRAEAVCMMIAALMAGIWFVPLCLEYLWVFLVAFGVCIPALVWGRKQEWDRIWILFLISGILTNYLDFLTTEVLVPTMPLLLLLAMRGKKNTSGNGECGNIPRTPAGIAIKACILWSIGYACMWVTKWILAALILGMDVTPYLSEHIAEHVGALEGVPGNPFSAVFINLITLIPLGMGDVWTILSLIAFIVFICFLFVYRKKAIRRDYIIAYLIIGAIPLLRYAVLFGHSFRHFVFTYRSLMATVLAVGLMALEVTDDRLFGRRAA